MLDPAMLGVFVVASVALLLTPGPAVLYIVARSVEQGRTAGLVSVAGILVGTVFHIVAAAVGLSALLMSSALAFSIVKYLGAAYLIWLGLRTIFARDANGSGNAALPRRPLRRIFRDGVVVNVLNPKTALFFLAFLPQFVNPAQGHVALQILLLGLIFMALGAVSDGAYALAAGSAGDWLKRNRQFVRLQRWLAGLVFIGLGAATALSGNGRK